MKYSIIFLSLIIFSFTSKVTENDCRNFNYGVSSEFVKANEQGEFVREEMLSHDLKGLTYVEFNPTSTILYTYTFHFDKLNGLKIKKLSPNGDNSYLNAYNNYKETLSKYITDCEGYRIKESVDGKGLKSFHISNSKSKIYVMMEQDNQDYFLVENIFKK